MWFCRHSKINEKWEIKTGATLLLTIHIILYHYSVSISYKNNFQFPESDVSCKPHFSPSAELVTPWCPAITLSDKLLNLW